MAATLKVLEHDGLNALTVEGIAAAAGVGKATIYRWWPSRIALVLEAIEQLPELHTPDKGSLVEDLRALLTDLSELLVSTPLGGVLAHLGSDTTGRDPEVREYLRRRMAPSIALVDRAVQRGELPADTDTETLVYLTVGPVINRVFFGTPPDDEYIDLVVRTMAAGFPVAMTQRSNERRTAGA